MSRAEAERGRGRASESLVDVARLRAAKFQDHKADEVHEHLAARQHSVEQATASSGVIDAEPRSPEPSESWTAGWLPESPGWLPDFSGMAARLGGSSSRDPGKASLLTPGETDVRTLNFN